MNYQHKHQKSIRRKQQLTPHPQPTTTMTKQTTPEIALWIDRSRKARRQIHEMQKQAEKDHGIIRDFPKLERLQSEYRYAERMCWHFANIPNESPAVFNS
jgi:hypothetical protein